MIYCPNCGREVNEDSKFCAVCGTTLTEGVGYVKASKVSKKNAITSFVLGLVNIELCICSIFPYACLIFFPMSLVLAILGISKANKYVDEAASHNAFSKIGKIVSIVSLILSIVFFIIGLLLTLIPGAGIEFYEILLDMYDY